MLEQLQRALRRFNDSAPRHRRLHVGGDGASLVSAKSHREFWRIDWQSVEEIVTFKMDAITLDHICLAFRERGSGQFHITDEETPGWQELCETIAQRFPLDPPDWLTKVALPPFATNHTVLWRAG